MRNDDLEELLQAGLKSYGEAEPLHGIEERVIRRVQEQRSQSRWMWLRWGGAAACACLLMILGFGIKVDWHAHNRMTEEAKSTLASVPRGALAQTYDQNTTPPNASNSVSSAVPGRQYVHAGGWKKMAAKQEKRETEILPKLNLFPTPQSLTVEERALMLFAKEHPEAAAQLFAAERLSSEPIQIASIYIEPLH